MRPSPSRRLSHPGQRFCYRPLGQSGAMANWLTHVSSLTARIRARCKQFGVIVRFEGLKKTTPPEARWLRVRRAYVREVTLVANGIAVVEARTVIHPRSLRGSWRFMTQLGTRPLGARLFSDPLISRAPFVFGRSKTGAGYAPFRIAKITRKGCPIVLTERILPSVLDLDGCIKN
jgi:chorismate-pyruvate lyase